METEYCGYVSMTDTFLSGWGGAKDKIAKLVICCRTPEEVDVALTWARLRDEMKYISFQKKKPYYSKSRYQVTYWDYSEETTSLLSYIKRKG